MGRSLVSAIGEERYQLLRRENPILATMLRYENKLS
jgi:hypothetical protein